MIIRYGKGRVGKLTTPGEMITYSKSGVKPGPPGSPVNTSPPVISGTTYEGSVLSCAVGAWDNGVSTFAFDWQRGGVSTGHSSNNYLVELDDASAAMTCVVTATNAIGSNVATSNTLVMDGVEQPNLTGTFDIPDGTAGDTLDIDLTTLNTGGNVDTWEIVGAYPLWVTINESTGALTGTYAQGEWSNYQIKASNAGGVSFSNADSVIVTAQEAREYLTFNKDGLTSSYATITTQTIAMGDSILLSFKTSSTATFIPLMGLSISGTTYIYIETSGTIVHFRLSGQMRYTVPDLRDGLPHTLEWVRHPSDGSATLSVDGGPPLSEDTLAVGTLTRELDYVAQSLNIGSEEISIWDLEFQTNGTATDKYNIDSGAVNTETENASIGAGVMTMVDVTSSEWEGGTVEGAPALTGTFNIPNGSVGQTLSMQLNALLNTGGIPDSWAWSGAGTPPSWANLDLVTGELSGTYEEGAWDNYSVTATNTFDSSASNTDDVTVTIASQGPELSIPLVVPDTGGGIYFSLDCNNLNTGDPADSWQFTGSPPAWLTLTTESGILYGFAETGTSGTFGVQAINANGFGNSNQVTVTVSAVAIFAPPAGQVGVPYSYTNVQGMSPPYTLRGAIPNGISINDTTGELSGIPTFAHSFEYLQLEGNGGSLSQPVTLDIALPAGAPTTTPDTYNITSGQVITPIGVLTNDMYTP